MSEFFIARIEAPGGDEISVFHVPLSDKDKIAVPEQIMRAHGRIGLLGSLRREADRAFIADIHGDNRMPEDTTLLEETTPDRAVKLVCDFLSEHRDLGQFEYREELPAKIIEALVENESDFAQQLVQMISSTFDEDESKLHTGMYL